MATVRDKYEISGKITAGDDTLEYQLICERKIPSDLYEAAWSLKNTRMDFELSGKLPAGSYESVRQFIERLVAGGGYADFLKLLCWFK
jgi:hypothetical protein